MLTNDAPAFSSRSICLLFHHSAGPGRRVGTSRIIFFDTHHITYINIPLGWHACLHLLGPFGFPLRYHSLVYCCASRPHSGCQQGKGKHGSGRGGGGCGSGLAFRMGNGACSFGLLGSRCSVWRGLFRTREWETEGGALYIMRFDDMLIWCLLQLLMSAAATCSGVLFYFLGS